MPIQFNKLIFDLKNKNFGLWGYMGEFDVIKIFC